VPNKRGVPDKQGFPNKQGDQKEVRNVIKTGVKLNGGIRILEKVLNDYIGTERREKV